MSEQQIRQQKVVDAWNQQKIRNDGIKNHTYTSIVKIDGILKKGNPVSITGAQLKWKKIPDYIYSDLRISGKEYNIVKFLELLGYPDREIDDYLRDSYTMENSLYEDSELNGYRLAEALAREEYVGTSNGNLLYKKQQHGGKIYIIIAKGNVETRYALGDVPVSVWKRINK